MDPRGRPVDPVGTAIHRVLEAEREAQADVARARAEAEARVAAARGEAIAISAAADRRIAAARASVDARLARREAEVEESVRALRAAEAHDRGDPASIRCAARALAASLTREEAP